MTELTQKQRRAIQSLVTARTMGEAAKTAGVNPRSLTRWMDDPAFKAEVERVEGLAIDAATRQLAFVSGDAVAYIAELMHKPTLSPLIRLKAAGMILTNVLKMRELHNLEERVTRLEDLNNDSKA